MSFKLTKLLSETNLDVFHVQMWRIYILEVQHEISKSYLAMELFFSFLGSLLVPVTTIVSWEECR